VLNTPRSIEASVFVLRAGAKLLKKTVEGQIKYFLEGDFKIEKGAKFDKNGKGGRV